MSATSKLWQSVSERIPPRRSKPIRRTPQTESATIQDVGVDHRRPDVGWPRQLLNDSNVSSVLRQVRNARFKSFARGLPSPLPNRSLFLFLPSACNRQNTGLRRDSGH